MGYSRNKSNAMMAIVFVTIVGHPLTLTLAHNKVYVGAMLALALTVVLTSILFYKIHMVKHTAHMNAIAALKQSSVKKVAHAKGNTETSHSLISDTQCQNIFSTLRIDGGMVSLNLDKAVTDESLLEKLNHSTIERSGSDLFIIPRKMPTVA